MLKLSKSTINSSTLVSIYTLFFYLSLYLTNPGRKIIAVSYIALFIVYFVIIKNFKISLFLTWIASNIVFTGKEYRFELIPPGIYSYQIFPYGVVQIVNITPFLIIGLIMTASLLRNIIKKTDQIALNQTDLLIIALYAWLFFKDFLWSKNPQLSIVLSAQGLIIITGYLYLKFSEFTKKVFIRYFQSIFIGLIIFQSIVTGTQIINRAPLYKNIEAQVNVEYFGHTADEKNLPYRPVGTFEHANYLALWFGILLCYALSINVKSPDPKANLFIILICSVIVSTLSRSAWIGLVVAVLLQLWIFIKIKKINPFVYLQSKIPIILICLLPVISFYLVPRIIRSFNTLEDGGGVLRTQQFIETIQIIKLYPFTGVGTGQSLQALRELNPSGVFSKVALTTHNWFLLFTAEHGIIGITIWIILILIIVKRFLIHIIKAKTINQVVKLEIGWLSSLVFVIIFGLFQPQIRDDMIVIGFAIINNLAKHAQA